MVHPAAYPAEIQRWVGCLRSQVQEERLVAATQLGRIGVRTRGAVRTRGSLSAPAPSRLPQEHLDVALQALADVNPEVRREVAFMLGEWADAAAVTVLSNRVKEDEDWGVRAAVATALAKIGGPVAVQTLQALAKDDLHEDVRASAINGLANLAFSDEVSPRGLGERLVRTRGSSRREGAVVQGEPQRMAGVRPEVSSVLGILESIRDGDVSEYVRRLAESSLASLGD